MLVGCDSDLHTAHEVTWRVTTVHLHIDMMVATMASLVLISLRHGRVLRRELLETDDHG